MNVKNVFAADALAGAYGVAQLFCFLPYQLLLSVTFVLFPLLASAKRETDEAAPPPPRGRTHPQPASRLGFCVSATEARVLVEQLTGGRTDGGARFHQLAAAMLDWSAMQARPALLACIPCGHHAPCHPLKSRGGVMRRRSRSAS